MKNKCGVINSGKTNSACLPIMEWKCYCETTGCREIIKRKINLNKFFPEKF